MIETWKKDIIEGRCSPKEQIFFNLYEKINFIKTYFDDGSTINISNRYSEEEKLTHISYLVGNVNNSYTFLEAKDILQHGISPFYPYYFDAKLIINIEQGLKNDEPSRLYTLERWLGNSQWLADYQQTLLSKSLPEKQYKKINSKKI